MKVDIYKRPEILEVLPTRISQQDCHIHHDKTYFIINKPPQPITPSPTPPNPKIKPILEKEYPTITKLRPQNHNFDLI